MRKHGWSVHQFWVTPTKFSILHEVGTRIADVKQSAKSVTCIWRAASICEWEKGYLHLLLKSWTDLTPT